MSRTYRAFLIVLCSVLVCLVLSVPSVLAANASGSVSIRFDTTAGVMSDYEIRLYHVASYDQGNLTLTEKFDYPVDIDIYDSESLTAMAYTLESYVIRDNLAADIVKNTDKSGFVKFSDLSVGLYLLTGDRISVGGHWYEMNPVLLMLPYSQDGTLVFDAELDAKYETGDIPTDDSDETVNYRVRKEWAGSDVHPDEVTVEFLKDGTVYDRVVLSEDNNWSHWWTQLPIDHEYRVVEVDIPEQYTVQIVRDGVQFVITNQYQDSVIPEEPEDDEEPGPSESVEPTPVEPTPEQPEPSQPVEPGLPQSGQDWAVVLGFGFIGLGVLLIGLLSYRRERRDDK